MLLVTFVEKELVIPWVLIVLKTSQYPPMVYFLGKKNEKDESIM